GVIGVGAVLRFGRQRGGYGGGRLWCGGGGEGDKAGKGGAAHLGVAQGGNAPGGVAQRRVLSGKIAELRFHEPQKAAQLLHPLAQAVHQQALRQRGLAQVGQRVVDLFGGDAAHGGGGGLVGQ